MSRPRKVLITLACLVAGLTFFAIITWRREPTYEGRSLSEWLLKYSDDNQEISGYQACATDMQAVRAIGTNALPHLLPWLQTDPSPLEPILLRYVPPHFRRSHPHLFLTSNGRRMLAIYGFQLLGTNAAPALPELGKLASDTTRYDAASIAMRAITALTNGPVFPPQMGTYQNAPSHPVRQP